MYAHMNGNRRMPSTEQALSDGDLMRQVADGSAEALGLLHRRFARLIFGMAVQSLDRAAAEDLVQEVFLAVWRNARRFDPERGTVRAWVLQITHYRLLNELRHRNRQPDIVPDPEGLVLADLPASDPGPAEATWEQHRRTVLKSALDELPPSQHARTAMGGARRHLPAGGSRHPLPLRARDAGALRSRAVPGDGERQREPPAGASARDGGSDARPLPQPSRRRHRRGHLLPVPAGAGWTDLPGVGAARGHVDLARHRGARCRRERPSHRRRPGARRAARRTRGHARTSHGKRRTERAGGRRVGAMTPATWGPNTGRVAG